MTRHAMTTVLVLAAAALAGCHASRSGDKITVELDGAEAKAKAKEAGREVKAGAEAAGAALDAGKQELDVRTAIALDETIDRSRLRVDADVAAHSVTLSGSVPTEDQKARAEAIAREKADGWTIVNFLSVAPLPASPPAPSGPAGISIGMPAPVATSPAPASAP